MKTDLPTDKDALHASALIRGSAPKRKCPKVTVGSRWWSVPLQAMYKVTYVKGLKVWIKPADIDVTLAGLMHIANMRNPKCMLPEAEYLELKAAWESSLPNAEMSHAHPNLPAVAGVGAGCENPRR